jgi:hypothetical protein
MSPVLNYRAGLDAGVAPAFAFENCWSDTTQHGCWVKAAVTALR